MEIEILQEQLLQGLMIVSKAVATRVQLPVLSHILIEATKEGLILSATDLEIGIKVKVNARVIETGITAVPAKMFGEFLNSLNPGKIGLKLEKNSLVLSAPGYSSKFQTINSDEFPRITEVTKESEICTIEASLYTEAVTRVVFASAKDSLRPVLTGVLWEFSKKKIKIVATDGFRLAVEDLSVEAKIDQTTLLVPSRVVLEVIRLANGGKISIGYLPTTNQIYFKVEETLVISQLLVGNFPDYQKILPKEFTTEISVNKDELLQAIKASYIFSRDNSNMVKWQIVDGKLTILSNSPEKGECAVELPVALVGDNLEIIFNIKYILDYLLIVEGPTLWVGMGSKLSPGMIKDLKRDSGQYVVMPINA